MSNKVIKLKSKKSNSRWIIILILLVTICLIYFVFSFNKISKVEIVGDSKYSKEEICDMIGIKEGDSFLSAYIAKRKKINFLPFIEELNVNIRSMDRVLVSVKDKEVTSLIPFQEDYVVIDKDGYVLGYEPEIISGVPISRGINLDEAVIGEIVPIDKRILDVVLLIYFSAKKNLIDINEIFFLGGSPEKIHIHINDINILLGDASNIDEKMKTARAVLEKLPQNSKGSLDLSKSRSSYVFKNDFELRYYVIDDRGFCAVDKNYIIKKISHSKFNDSITVSNLEAFAGNVGEEAKIIEEEKILLDSIIAEANKNNLNLKGIDLKFGKKEELAIFTDKVKFVLGKNDETIKKIKIVKAYLDDLDEKEEKNNEKKELPIIYIDKIKNKYQDLD